MTILDPEEFSKPFRLRVDFEIQLTNKCLAYLREVYDNGHSLKDVVEELTSYLFDTENCNIVDSDAEIDYIEDLFPDLERTT